jgi:endonuclease III
MKEKRMNNRQSLYLLWATILNQSQSAETVLKNTFKLFKRLKLLSNFDKEYKNLNYEIIEKGITTKPCLHRFPRNMSMNIWDSICMINQKYKGNPKEVFAKSNVNGNIKGRLMEFQGIGEHKADTAIIILKIFEGSKGLNSVFEAKCTELFKTIEQEMQFLDKLGDVEFDR